MVDKKKNKGTLKKVFSYIGKYKYFLIFTMFFARLQSVLHYMLLF